MQEMTKKTLTKLLKDTSHAIVAEDFDDIEALDKLAQKVANQTPDEKRLLNQPYELCGIKFYPLTIAKSLWYAEKVEEWNLEGLFQDVLLFWLLTLPDTDTALDAYSLRKDADRAIKKLSRRLHCTQKEMTDVFQKCIGGKGEEGNGDQISYGALIAVLLREYGGTPDQWLYKTPVEKIGALIDQYSHRINAENDASRTSASHRGKAIAPVPTAKLQALKDYRIKTNEIAKKWGAHG